MIANPAKSMDSDDDEVPLAVGLDETDSAYAFGKQLQTSKTIAAQPGQHDPTPVTLITGEWQHPMPLSGQTVCNGLKCEMLQASWEQAKRRWYTTL